MTAALIPSMNQILAAVIAGILALTIFTTAPTVESAPALGVAVAAHHAAFVSGVEAAGGAQ